MANPRKAIERSKAARRSHGAQWHYTDKSGAVWHGVEEMGRGVELREVGPAHEILRLRHTGYYMDAFQEETVHGVVFRLPHGRFLAGYEDPWNEGMYIFDPERFEDEKEAARRADRAAEIYAEAEREWDELWQAARRWEALGEELASLRDEARALIPAVRTDPRLCVSLRRVLRARETAQHERRQVWADHSWHPQWKDALLA